MIKDILAKIESYYYHNYYYLQSSRIEDPVFHQLEVEDFLNIFKQSVSGSKIKVWDYGTMRHYRINLFMTEVPEVCI